MNFVQLGDLRVHYSLTGRAGAPVVTLSHSLGTDLTIWDQQTTALEKQFRVLRYDTRGHGRTSAPDGPYSIEQLARDAIGLLDALGLEQAYFCGISLGGMIGMWLALHAPDRFPRLALANTAARIGTAETWNNRIEQIRREGMRSVSVAAVERWLTADFRTRSPELVRAMQHMFESTPIEGYVACCAAIRDADFRAVVSSIRVPALVISGTRDPATPVADGRFLADRIPGARYTELDVAHLSNLEAPEQFSAALIHFLVS